MNFSDEFLLLLNARYPILYIHSFEEDRLEYSIRKSLNNLQERAIYTWDFIEGYTNNPNIRGFAAKNPLQALDLVEKLTAETAAIFILKDFNKFLNDVSVSRKLKNLGRILKTQPKTLILHKIATTINWQERGDKSHFPSLMVRGLMPSKYSSPPIAFKLTQFAKFSHTWLIFIRMIENISFEKNV